MLLFKDASKQKRLKDLYLSLLLLLSFVQPFGWHGKYSAWMQVDHWTCTFLSAACRCEPRHHRPRDCSQPLKPTLPSWTVWLCLLLPSCQHTCSFMKRGEKPEGYRQMRPNTFPTSNYSGNSQQMLQEIRNSLRNLPKPSDPPKMDIGGAGKMLTEDPRQAGRCSNPKNSYHKALQEIRKSLMPFANEPSTSGPTVDMNKHILEPPSAAFEGVRHRVHTCSLFCHWDRLVSRIAEECHSTHNFVIVNDQLEHLVEGGIIQNMKSMQSGTTSLNI